MATFALERLLPGEKADIFSQTERITGNLSHRDIAITLFGFRIWICLSCDAGFSPPT